MESLNATNATTAKPTSSNPGFSIGVVYAYATIGTCGMAANLFIITVLLSDRKFLKQSANVAGIAFSHLMCAVAIGATGYHRAVNYDHLGERATTWSCAMKVYPALMPICFQCTGVMLVLIGVERFCVFMFPNWYRTTWTNKKNWQIVGLCYLGLLVSLCVGLYKSWYQPMTTISCGYTTVLGKDFFLYGMAVSALGGVASACLTLIGLIKGTQHAKKLPLLSGEAGRHRRQIKLTQSMLSVAVCDFCLVVLPSFFYILSTIDSTLFPSLVFANLSNFTNMTYCLNTTTTLPTYLAYHRQFRSFAAALFQPKKSKQVTPASGPVTAFHSPADREMRTISVKHASGQ